jgi:hypothetical protein
VGEGGLASGPIGVLTIGAGAPAAGERPTIIVGGGSRTGTSNVAAALHAAGLWMGDRIDHAFFEDAELAAIAPGPMRAGARRRPTLRPGRAHPGLRDADLAALRRLIEERNRRFATWGFKRPKVEVLLGASGVRLFRDPRVVVTVRDPLAVAERVATAEGLDLVESLEKATSALTRSVDAATRLGVPTMLVSYERMRTNPRPVLERLFAFAGLEVGGERWAALEERVRAAGREYVRLASGPPVGHIDRYDGGILTGWCRQVGRDEPVQVEVFVDDVPAASAMADEYRADLERAGFGSGRFGFHVRIDGVAPGPTSRIRAVIAGTGVPLERSGSTLAELAADGPRTGDPDGSVGGG